jgi:hypothetical protein
VDTSLVAARVREVLRNAGCREWETGRRGFQVEGDPQGGWVVVALYAAIHTLAAHAISCSTAVNRCAGGHSAVIAGMASVTSRRYALPHHGWLGEAQ